MTQAERLAEYRQFKKLMAEQFGPDWKTKAFVSPVAVIRFDGLWAEFGLISDPDAPPPRSDYGLYQFTSNW